VMKAPAGSAEVAARMGLLELLDARRDRTVAEYEAFAHASATGAPSPTGRSALCHCASVRDDKRRYERTRSLA
jgi:hypothetical protein